MANEIKGFSTRGVRNIESALLEYKRALKAVVNELDTASINVESAIKGTNAATEVRRIARTAKESVDKYVESLISEFKTVISDLESAYEKQDRGVDFSGIRLGNEEKKEEKKS